MRHLVHDPNNSLRNGDVVEIVSGWRTSKHKRFIVNRIVAPFGPPIDERPPVPTQEQREAQHAMRRAAKKERKKQRDKVDMLEKRVAKAQKLTSEITRMAWQMRIVDSADWTPASSTTGQ